MAKKGESEDPAPTSQRRWACSRVQPSLVVGERSLSGFLWKNDLMVKGSQIERRRLTRA